MRRGTLAQSTIPFYDLDMGSVPLVGWYIALIRRAAQPRDPSAPERHGLDRVLFGSSRPGEGWGVELWGWQALPLLMCAIGAAAVGLWWLSLIVLPVLFYPLARMVGTYRERSREPI